VTKTSEAQTKSEQPPAAAPGKKSGQTILALSIFALGLNAAAAVYTMSPADFALPDVRGVVAELLPHDSATAPKAMIAALADIQSAQQHNATATRDYGSLLQENTSLLHRDGSVLVENSALLQQHGALLEQNNALLLEDSSKLDTLRSSLTDERTDVKTISSQLTTLIAKVDSLQNKMTSEFTSSIPKARAHTRVSVMARKRIARRMKPEDPFSFGDAPQTTAPHG
jgi:uncharacterized coiled-coil protein SlyX